MSLGDEELRALAGRIVAGQAEPADEEELARDPEVAREIAERLERCGMRLFRQPDRPPLALIDGVDELGRLQRAALAHCALRLHPDARRRGERVAVTELAELLSQKESYVRRAVLGPLERRGFVRVVKPDQRATGAYVTAGPLLRALDLPALEARLGEG